VALFANVRPAFKLAPVPDWEDRATACSTVTVTVTVTVTCVAAVDFYDVASAGWPCYVDPNIRA
jgi:hypothetical protein